MFIFTPFLTFNTKVTGRRGNAEINNCPVRDWTGDHLDLKSRNLSNQPKKKGIRRPSNSTGEIHTITQVNQETTSFDTPVLRSACQL